MNCKILTPAVVAVTILLFAGCASAGTAQLRGESEATIAHKIVEGRTTLEEVKAIFGSPQNTSFTDAGSLIVTYKLLQTHPDPISYVPLVGLVASSRSGKKTELVVLFDGQGVVKKVSFGESPVQVKRGLLNLL